MPASSQGPRRRQIVRRRRAAVAGALGVLALVLGLTLGGGGSSHARARGAASAGGTLARASHTGTSGYASSAARAGAGSPESATVRRLVALGLPIYCAAPRGNEVALTFDDGPGPYTRLVLAKLHKHHIHATFFDVARNIPLLPGATAQERAIGALGDHTLSHPLLTSLAPPEAEAEMARAQAALERSSGARVFLFRPPYGGRNRTIDDIARAHGMLEILWTVDSADSLGADYAQIERNVIGGLHGGAIILMHENHGQTVRALLPIFAALARRHLHAVSVAQLLTDDPPSPQQLRAGQRGCGTVAQARTGD